jgi:hypothetical protein
MVKDVLRELLAPQSEQGEGYVWELCVLEGAEAETLSLAAAVLAERIVTYVCRRRPDLA